MEQKSIPVSERALFARVSRKLYKEGFFLRRCRIDSPYFNDLGRYYCVDFHNHLGGPWLDNTERFVEYAKEIGALRDYEHLAE